MDPRELKEKATQHYAKGRFGKAAENYEAYCKADPKDLQSRLRTGDCWVKDGQPEKAIAAYLSAAEGFAREGFLPRAIAASKLVLELDPAHTGVQRMLAELYARKSSTPSRIGRPPPAAAPAEPEVTQAVEPPGIAPGFAERRDALDLDPAKVSDEVAFADLPPPPARRTPEAVELELDAPVHEDEEPTIVAALAIEVETEEAGAGEATIAIELEGEATVLDALAGPPPPAATPGFDLTLEDLEPAPQPAAPPPAAPGFELTLADLDPAPPPAPSPGFDLTLADLDPVPPPAPSPGFDLTLADLDPVPPPAPSPGFDLTLADLEDAPPPAASPGFDLTLADLEDAPPPRARPDADARPLPRPLPPAGSAVSGRSAVRGELEQRLQDLIDEAGPVGVPAPPAASFTELELDDGDSILHTVVAASAVPPAAEEETLEAPEELAPDALPRIPLFSDLPEAAFIALFTRCPLRRLELGETVVAQGTRGDAFYVVCAGQVKVSREEGGQRRELATLEEGSFFGEMALLSAAPRSASVEASAEDTQLLEISASVLTELSRQHPTVAQALKKFCRQRLLSNLMATAPLFQPFSRSDRKDLIARFRSRDLPAGEVILEEGRASDGLYVVLSGEVRVSVKGAPVASLREGELFGEMSLLTHTPAGATVRSSRHTSLLRLPREDFGALISSHPQILELVAELTERRQQANARLGLV